MIKEATRLAKTANTQESGNGSGTQPRGGGARRADPNRLWRHILALDQRLFDQRNVRLLTPEGRVLIHLTLSGSTSVTDAMQVAGTSYRGFYAVLERLREAGIVATVKDEDDQRVRRLSIDPSVAINS